MTLKEKIIYQVQEMPLEVSPTKKDIDNYNLSINHLEKIAEEFAIEFSEWCNELRMHGQGYYEKTTKELLEMFKKEKGL